MKIRIVKEIKFNQPKNIIELRVEKYDWDWFGFIPTRYWVPLFIINNKKYKFGQLNKFKECSEEQLEKEADEFFDKIVANKGEKSIKEIIRQNYI